MFMDGLIYSTVAKNLSEGIGTFWMPHFTQTVHSEFYEHPPLAFGIQALFFKAFGDGFITEKIYCFVTAISTLLLMLSIWKKETGNYNGAWILIIMYATIGNVGWAFPNNLLENTMGVFLLIAYRLLQNENKLELNHFVAGIFIGLGFLTKGFFALFLWSVPFFYWLVFERCKMLKMIGKSLSLIAGTISLLGLIALFSDVAYLNLTQYFLKQVVNSVENIQTVNSRWAIWGSFFESTAISIVVFALISILALYKNRVEFILDYQATKSRRVFYLLIVFSGIIPIMLSLKQRGFYIQSIYPFFCIALTISIYKLVQSWLNNLRKSIVNIVSISVFCLCVAISIIASSRTGRDQMLISDTKAVIQYTGSIERILIPFNLKDNWSLHGYFMRLGKISLDNYDNSQIRYYLTNNKADVPIEYEPIRINLEEYYLYKIR
jgi:hypothetical protein